MSWQGHHLVGLVGFPAFVQVEDSQVPAGVVYRCGRSVQAPDNPRSVVHPSVALRLEAMRIRVVLPYVVPPGPLVTE